jgi:putative membrane protein
MFDQPLSALSAAAGACERIANTPIPYPHGVLLHRTMYAYCYLLPFGLVDAIGAATPLISVLLAYTLFALEEIAQQVADPFGRAPNALALNALSRGVERAVMDLCGQPVPKAVEPDGYVLG